MSNRRRLGRLDFRAPLPHHEPPIEPNLPTDQHQLNLALGGSGGERPGMVNAYLCAEKHATFVIVTIAGVTPSGFACPYVVNRHRGPESCGLRAWSTWYRLPANYRPEWVTMEWYRQSPNAARRTGGREAALYAADGGLMLRPLQPATANGWQVGPMSLRDEGRERGRVTDE